MSELQFLSFSWNPFHEQTSPSQQIGAPVFLFTVKSSELSLTFLHTWGLWWRLTASASAALVHFGLSFGASCLPDLIIAFSPQSLCSFNSENDPVKISSMSLSDWNLMVAARLPQRKGQEPTWPYKAPCDEAAVNSGLSFPLRLLIACWLLRSHEHATRLLLLGIFYCCFLSWGALSLTHSYKAESLIPVTYYSHLKLETVSPLSGN